MGKTLHTGASMKSYIVLLLSLFLVVSCSSRKKEEKEIDTKAAQSKVTNAQALAGSIDQAINESTTLKEEQKEKLRLIVEENKSTAMKLAEESYKYRDVLVHELFSGKATNRRIRIIKSDINRVEKARLKNTFDTIKKMSDVLNGHPENQKFADHYMNTFESIGSSK